METLDKCFENVCELDLIFHMDKVGVEGGVFVLRLAAVQKHTSSLPAEFCPFPVSEQPTQLFPTCVTTALACDVNLLSVK